jgi:hypothetical protein
MTLLVIALLIMSILITLPTGDITNNLFYLEMTVNKKHISSVTFINVSNKLCLK